jgi:hypothetical protein
VGRETSISKSGTPTGNTFQMQGGGRRGGTDDSGKENERSSELGVRVEKTDRSEVEGERAGAAIVYSHPSFCMPFYVEIAVTLVDVRRFGGLAAGSDSCRG